MSFFEQKKRSPGLHLSTSRIRMEGALPSGGSLHRLRAPGQTKALCPGLDICEVALVYLLGANLKMFGTYGFVKPFETTWDSESHCALHMGICGVLALSLLGRLCQRPPGPSCGCSVEVTYICLMQNSLEKSSSLCCLMSAFQITTWTENTHALQFLTGHLHRSFTSRSCP